MGLFGMAISYIAFSILHFFQFVIAVAVCGLYAVDLNRAHQEGKYTDGKWVYAVVVGALSAVTSLLCLVPFILRFAAVTAWSFALAALWLALFGVFGRLYIGEDPEGGPGVRRMRNAVWVDLAGALLWVLGSFASLAYWWTHRERGSRFTGRARLGRSASTSGAWRA